MLESIGLKFFKFKGFCLEWGYLYISCYPLTCNAFLSPMDEFRHSLDRFQSYIVLFEISPFRQWSADMFEYLTLWLDMEMFL